MEEAPIKQLLSELSNFPRPVGIFIDGPNVFKCLQERNWLINWQNFAALMKRVFQNVSFSFCASHDSGNVSQQNFLSFLKTVGFNVFYQEIVKRNPPVWQQNSNPLHWLYNPFLKASAKSPNGKNGSLLVKGDVDALVGFQIGKQAEILKTIILLSGDYNFFPVLEDCKKMGKKIIIMSFKYSLSNKLAELADKVVFLDDDSIKLFLRFYSEVKDCI